MSTCFHIQGVQCDNCRTGLDDRPYVAVVTTGGTYLSAQDFLTSLRQVEIERDEARAEVDRLKRRIEAMDAASLVIQPAGTEAKYQEATQHDMSTPRWRLRTIYQELDSAPESSPNPTKDRK